MTITGSYVKLYLNMTGIGSYVKCNISVGSYVKCNISVGEKIPEYSLLHLSDDVTAKQILLSFVSLNILIIYFQGKWAIYV